MPELIKLSNPLRKHERQIVKVGHKSVENILNEEIKDMAVYGDDVLTYINGIEIVKVQRAKRILKDGEYLLVVPKAAGDDAGKTILSIAIMVVAVWYAPTFAATFAYTMTEFALLKIAFIVGAAMLEP